MRSDIASIFMLARKVLVGPHTLAFLPAICLGAFWYGGERALILAAILFPTAATAVFGFSIPKRPLAGIDVLTLLPLRPALLHMIDDILNSRTVTGRTTSCIAICIDDFSELRASLGKGPAEDILKTSARRVQNALREHDLVVRLDGPKFAVGLAAMPNVDLEMMIQLSSRLQAALSEPISIDATKLYVSASIGFCLPQRAPEMSGAALLEAAEVALDEARSNGSGSIRAFSLNTPRKTLDRKFLLADVATALENGQIIPWFQPQISTDTGKVSGMEALARWIHPDKGVIPPSKFLPAIEELGLAERLGEVILYHAFSALQSWDKAGFEIPSVSVNFSATEFANPDFVSKIQWELDRFDFEPSRLTVEILENVISAADNDMIVRNIWTLSQLGCKIDLDDYGTGHASIANIRRFAVSRIKIDRSYVAKCDVDRDQQNMLAAILTMAERIDLATLAEGVETVGEHAMLAQLGCGHVQGFSVSRPISFEKTLEWLDAHRQKRAQTLQIGRKAS